MGDLLEAVKSMMQTKPSPLLSYSLKIVEVLGSFRYAYHFVSSSGYFMHVVLVSGFALPLA